MNAYIDPYTYNRSGSGIDTTQYVANLTRIASPGVALGATSIPLIAPLTTALSQYDQLTVFDGANSEVLIVGLAASIGAMSVTVSPMLAAHVAGTPICSDGSQGSLAQAIIDASAELEIYCRQSLFQATYSNESLPLRSMRAAVSREGQLLIRPKHFPVSAISGVTLQIQGGTTIALNTAYAQIDADAQVVTMTQLSSTSGSATFWGAFRAPAMQTTPGTVQLSYTAGFSLIPSGVKDAATLLTSDILNRRRNPSGAAETQMGKQHNVYMLRGDLSGDSILVKRAMLILQYYKMQSF